jgi:hypothetical protein
MLKPRRRANSAQLQACGELCGQQHCGSVQAAGDSRRTGGRWRLFFCSKQQATRLGGLH